jgi:hypothetical protein
MAAELQELLAPVLAPEHLQSTIQKVLSILDRYPDFKTDPETQIYVWMDLIRFFRKRDFITFPAQKALWDFVYCNRNPEKDGPPIVWRPDPETVENAHVNKLRVKMGFKTYSELHRWSVENPEEYWERAIDKLKIVFKKKPKKILDLRKGPENPNWLVGAQMNIADSCFSRVPSQQTAIIYREEGLHQTPHLKIVTYKVSTTCRLNIMQIFFL